MVRCNKLIATVRALVGFSIITVAQHDPQRHQIEGSAQGCDSTRPEVLGNAR